MSEINFTPSKKDLRVFGFLLPLFFAVAGLLVRIQFGLPGAARWVWLAGLLLTLLYLVAAPLRRPLYVAWMVAAFPIGWAVSRLLLGLIYFGLLTPLAILMRLAGRDPMRRRWDRARKSYWEEHPGAPEAGRYFRQY